MNETIARPLDTLRQGDGWVLAGSLLIEGESPGDEQIARLESANPTAAHWPG